MTSALAKPSTLAAAGVLLLALIGAGIWQRQAIAQWVDGLWHGEMPKTAQPVGPGEKTSGKDGKRGQDGNDGASPTGRGSDGGTAKPGEMESSGVAAGPLTSPSSDAPSRESTVPQRGEGASPSSASTTTGKETYAAPDAVPERRVFRPAAGVTYRSLQEAIAAAGEGEALWLGPGTFEFDEALPPITKPLVLKGAGRDATRLEFRDHPGVVLRAASGGIEDVEICCAGGDAALIIEGNFHGTIARVRVRHAKGWAIIVRGSAAVDLVAPDFEGNGKGTVDVRRPATLSMR